MVEKISIETDKNFSSRTMELVHEMADVLPGAELDIEAPVTVKFTEDVGPQFITFKTPTHQFVFKIITFRTRKDMRISTTISKERSQLVLTNFNSDIGITVSEFLIDLFPLDLESNQIVNFAVHKDFIYFRMYRVAIKVPQPVMEMVGPMLTLRLWRMVEYREDGKVAVTHNFKKYVKNLNIL